MLTNTHEKAHIRTRELTGTTQSKSPRSSDSVVWPRELVGRNCELNPFSRLYWLTAPNRDRFKSQLSHGLSSVLSLNI